MFKNLVKRTTAKLFLLMQDRERPYEGFDELSVDTIISINNDLMEQDVEGYVEYIRNVIEEDDNDREDAEDILEDLRQIEWYHHTFKDNELYTTTATDRYIMHTVSGIYKGEPYQMYRIADTKNSEWLTDWEVLEIDSAVYDGSTVCELKRVSINGKTYRFKSCDWKR